MRCEHNGLTLRETSVRVDEIGPNTMPQARCRTALRIVGGVLREPMMARLLAGGGSYLLGDTAEALILLAFAAFSVAVTVVQEARTEHVLEALRDLSDPRAQVNKGSERMRIAGCDVVRDDLLILEQGDRVPADAVLLETHDLQVDEPLLTEESISVHKFLQTVGKGAAPQRPGGDNRRFVYSGSMITMGSGLAESPRRERVARSARLVHHWRRSNPRRRACGPKPQTS